MRLKHQSFVDKYIEKIVLGVAVIIAVVIVVSFVLGSYSVELTPGKRSSPAEVELAYKSNWEQLAKAIKPPPKDETDTRKYLPDQLQKLVVPDYKKRFDDRYSQKLVHSPSFYEIVFGDPGVPTIGVKGPTAPKPYFVVHPPAPKDIAASVSYYVLESNEILSALFAETAKNQDEFATDEEIRQRAGDWTTKAVSMAGKRDPRDFWGVSIAGTISPQEWIDLCAAVEADKRMDESWYRDIAQFVLGIEVYRQTRDEKTGKFPADGEPGERVELLPGDAANIIASYVKAVQEAKTGEVKVDEFDAAELQQELVSKLNLYTDRLTKPVFLPTKAHRPWQQPDEIVAQLSPEDQQAIFRLNQQINRYESELTVLRDRANSATSNSRLPIPTPETPGKTTRPPRNPPKALPPTPPATGKNTPVKPPVDPNAPKKDPSAERIAFYETKLTELYKQKDAILAKLHKDETDPTKTDPTKGPIVPPRGGFEGTQIPRGYEQPPRGGAFQPPRRPGDTRYGQPKVADGKVAPIKFWAHDVQVQPGATYRYRVVYKVINPMFNKDDQLIQDQRKLGGQLEQASLPSKWSDPVSIEPEVQYFVEDVKPEVSRVKWGIYRIYNGYRLHKQYDTSPGDPIGKTEDVEVRDDTGEKMAKKQPVDMRVNAVMVDLKSPPKGQGQINVKGPMAVLIADITDGAVVARDPASDKNDPERVRLFNEASGALGAPKPAGTDGRPPVPVGAERPPIIDRPPEVGGVRPPPPLAPR